jgi:hypothetical protein
MPREAFVEWQRRFGQAGFSALDRLREVKDAHGVIRDDDLRHIARELRLPLAAVLRSTAPNRVSAPTRSVSYLHRSPIRIRSPCWTYDGTNVWAESSRSTSMLPDLHG